MLAQRSGKFEFGAVHCWCNFCIQNQAASPTSTSASEWRAGGGHFCFVFDLLYWSPSQVLIPDVPKSCFLWCTYFLFCVMYLSPVFLDVPKSCLRCCIIFLFSMMYLIPVWAVGPYFCFAVFLMYLSPVFHDVPTSCFLWCTQVLYSLMYLSPVFHDVPTSCFPWCT